MMTSELFASIEGVGIGAFQLVREVEDSLTCYPKRMFISSLGRVGALGRPYSNHPFFLTKLCLIPPFPHEW